MIYAVAIFVVGIFIFKVLPEFLERRYLRKLSDILHELPEKEHSQFLDELEPDQRDKVISRYNSRKIP